MNAKKLIALALALVMVFAIVACGKKPPETQPSGTQPSGTQPSGTQPSGTQPSGTQPSSGPAVEDTYTYNTSIVDFPTNWNPHIYQTNTDSSMLSYMSDGFYGFDFNETMDGYKLVPYMTTDDHPIDITDQYVGQFGIEEGDTNQVYLINLRQDLMWNNGDKITANDFVESAKRLLNPAAQNYRADTLYSGSVKIYNAENYLKQGQTVTTDNNLAANYITVADLVKGADGVYTTADGAAVYIGIGVALDWLGGNSLSAYVNAYGDAYFGMAHWEELVALANDKGYVPVTDESLAFLTDVITANPAWGETADNCADYLCYDITYPAVDFADVGIIAKSDYEVIYVLTSPLEGFYLKYGLPSGFLVHIPTYDACEKIEGGVYSNTYGTSVETSMSYGPYIMTNFQLDKQIVFERNELYYDLQGGKYYKATHIVMDCVPEATTRLELFTSGKLDVYGLQADDMELYSLSDYCYYATGDSTFAMTFNPNLEALESEQANAGANINKTIITIPEFRMAMSFALDRAKFCLATFPTNSAAFGLFSDTIISDPDNGLSYRATQEAKETLAKFWDVADDYGEGKMFADIDEAIASITGYNLTLAKQYFDKAYDLAIEQGLMDADDVVEIMIGTPNATSAFYNNGYEFLVNNYTDAVKGTKLEGKLTFKRDSTLGNGFADALRNNTVDLLFGVGWTGSALDPYGLMEAYVKPDYQYDAALDYSTIMCTININGTDYTASVIAWDRIMNGEARSITDAEGNSIEYSCGTADNDPATRLAILAALERAVLLNYTFIPVMGDSSAQLKGMQIEYYNEEYIYGVGFGGTKYMEFNYSDAEWEAFLAENNYELDYT